MSHFPVNHHLRPVYRVITALVSVYFLVFGIIGLAMTTDLDFFAQTGTKLVLGMKANPAFSVLAIVLGAVGLLAAVVGRNIDVKVNWWLSSIHLLIGTAMLAFLRTDLNVLGFSMSNVIVVYSAGMLLMGAAVYGYVGTPAEADAEESFRHSH
ncbi:DUF4383 domain-containing protein [Longispora urticae]